MSNQLEQKESYFYGLLLALAKEQQTALQKQVAGNLNRWGQSRLKSRNKEMQKIMLHLFNTKNDAGLQVVPDILNDLAYIASNAEEWNEATPEEIESLREVLRELG
ncbi:MAG: hypothetical protein GQ569_10440 [Methylococcaceae bacterium]|nr:hypothetical protein [Methylococcaceae bacterium]